MLHGFKKTKQYLVATGNKTIEGQEIHHTHTNAPHLIISKELDVWTIYNLKPSGTVFKIGHTPEKHKDLAAREAISFFEKEEPTCHTLQEFQSR